MLGLRLNHISKRGPGYNELTVPSLVIVMLSQNWHVSIWTHNLYFPHDYYGLTVCDLSGPWSLSWLLVEVCMTRQHNNIHHIYTVYPKKNAHGFVVLCFVVVMQSFIMNSHEVFIHIHQGCFAGTGAIVRLPQCQWSKPDGYGKISQCITTAKHSKAKTVCIFLGIYCNNIL